MEDKPGEDREKEIVKKTLFYYKKFPQRVALEDSDIEAKVSTKKNTRTVIISIVTAAITTIVVLVIIKLIFNI